MHVTSVCAWSLQNITGIAKRLTSILDHTELDRQVEGTLRNLRHSSSVFSFGRYRCEHDAGGRLELQQQQSFPIMILPFELADSFLSAIQAMAVYMHVLATLMKLNFSVVCFNRMVRLGFSTNPSRPFPLLFTASHFLLYVCLRSCTRQRCLF